MLEFPREELLELGQVERGLLDDDGYVAVGHAGTRHALVGGDGLFPGGTRVFPSKFHLPRRVWLLAGGACFFTVLCLAVSLLSGFGSGARTGISSGVFALMVAADVVFGGLGYLWAKQARQDYAEKVASGLWLEGVFVFSTGDVVVRFNDLTRDVELEFDSGMLSGAYADDVRNEIRIRYTDLDGRPSEYKVDCSLMVHSPSEIAKSINSREVEVRSRDASVVPR